MHLAVPEDQLPALAAAHRLLKPGGVLFVALFNPDIPRALAVDGVMELADRWLDEETGAEVLKWSVRSLDLAEQIQETIFIYEEISPSGETRTHRLPLCIAFSLAARG